MTSLTTTGPADPATGVRPAVTGVRLPVTRGWSAWTPRSLLAMAGLCVIAVLLRSFAFRGLWIDEAIEVAQAKMPFGQMISRIAEGDVHPPLHHTLVWVTVRLFGTSEFAVRLPSMVAGVALVPVLFWVGRVCYDRRTGWVAAILATLAPFAVWYSQEARMYSLFMLLSALAVGWQVQAVRRGRRRDWIAYGVATALLMWTQYFALLPILVQQAGFLWVFWRDRAAPLVLRKRLRGWLLSIGVIAVALLPLIPILAEQLRGYATHVSVPGAAGAGASNVTDPLSIYSVGANLIWSMFGYHSDQAMVLIAALWPFAMLLAFLLLGRGRSGASVLLLMLIVVPLTALFVIGSSKRELFELRYFSGAVPAMLLLAARVVTAVARRRTALVIATCGLAALMFGMLIDQQVNGTNPRRYEFDVAFQEIADRARPGDVVLYTPSYLGSVFEYYVPEFDAKAIGPTVPGDRGVFVVATDLVVNTPSLSSALGTHLAALELNHDIVDTFTEPNIHVWQLEPR